MGLEDCSSRPGIVSRSLSRGGFLSLSSKHGFSLRVGNDFFGIFVDLCQLKVVVLVWYGTMVWYQVTIRYQIGTMVPPRYHWYHGTTTDTSGTVISITKKQKNGRKVVLLWGA